MDGSPCFRSYEKCIFTQNQTKFLSFNHKMSTNSQLIHIFRHAAYDANEDVNPPLSESGRNAAHEVFETHKFLEEPTLVITSPLTRCLETALHAFHPMFNHYSLKKMSKNHIKFLVDPRLREEDHFWCRAGDKRNMLPSRRDIPVGLKRYFTWPKEFYPDADDTDKDPDVEQDWYQMKGLWGGSWQSPSSLERGASFKEFL
jgi:Histidine phosphatase superfamily (branch 1)